MGWEDREYSRQPAGRGMGVLNWIMTGSVPLFRVFGISVRMHAAFLIMLALVLLFGFGPSTPFTVRLQFIAILWSIVLLHEFGHCFGARWTGGSADLITLNPLGGLAYAMSANNPWSRAWTVAAGPLVNVLICLVTGTAIYVMTGNVLLLPGDFATSWRVGFEWLALYQWLWMIHATSLGLLFFNLLPVFPLDGGQLMQALLWRPMGNYRSMVFTVNVGIVGAVLMMVWALFIRAGFGGGIMLLIGLNCLLNCIQWRTMLKSVDPWSFDGGMEDEGYSRALQKQADQQAAQRAKAAKLREKQQQQELAEQQEVDRILAKVGTTGMASLSSRERKTLERASENQRRRDAEREKKIRSGW